MAGSKSDRKLDGTYTIFANGKEANDAVRVGYIDPKRGYISGLSVYQANKYAEKNPGTQFIITNRDKIRYININEVNKLTNKDTLPSSNPSGLVDKNDEFDPCNTVRGFKTDPDTLGEPVISPPAGEGGEYGPNSNGADVNYAKYGSEKNTCRVRIELQGGGGIGALATPIVGLDGAILHVRMIHGGFGYKIPPQVRIIDDCKRGAGARGISVLGGVEAAIEENFDDEADVEEYDFKLGDFNYDPDDNPWGKIYEMSGQTVVGDWNPANILSLTNANSFQTELNAYLAFLKGYDPNKPWWTTRDETPVRVTGDKKSKKANKLGNVLFPVQHPAWGGEKNVSKDLINVEFEVYGQGSKGNRSIFYEFTAKDKSHRFKVKGITHEERNEKTRVDVIKVKANTTYDVVASVIKDRGAKSEVVEQGLLKNAGKNATENRKFQEEERSSTIFGDIVGSLNDNDDIQITAKKGRFKASNRRQVSVKVPDDIREKFKDQPNRFKRATFDLTYRVNVPGATNVTRTVLPSFMNNYAVAPQYESNQPGTDKAGKPYSLFYKEHFPHDGEYVFRGAADNQGEVLLDGEKIMDITDTFRQNPVKVKRQVKEGLHEIRIDLLNFPQKKIISETYTSDGGDKTKVRTVKFNVVGSGSGRHRKIKAVFTNKADASDNFTIDNDGENKEVREVQRKVTAGAKYDVKFIATAEKIDPNKEREISIDIASPGEKGRGKKARIGRVERKKIRYLDERGDDPNATLSIDSTSPGLTAKFSDDGSRIITKGNGDLSLKFKWDDDPKSAGKAVGRLKIEDITFKQVGEKGETIETIKIGKKSVNAIIEQGCIENGTKNKETKGSSNRVFADYLGSANDNDDMQVFVKKGGVFTSSNKRRINRDGEEGSKKGRGTFDLEYVFDVKTTGLKQDLWQDLKDQDIVNDSTGESLEKSDIEKAVVFNTRKFIDKANRKLYRMRPDVGPFGDFFNRDGITPFNPVELDREIPAVPPTVNPAVPFSKPKAKFIRKDGKVFLKVIGKGKANIGFKLKVDDNLRTSGVFAKEIRINADGTPVRLKRDINVRNGSLVGREKETIQGEGTFTAGREYEVKSIGGSATSGFEPVDKTIVFDDNIDNGLDNNGELEIRFIKPVDQPKSQPPKPPKNGRNNSSNKNLDDAVGSCDDYAGTHEIVWKDIKFPASGTYTVDVQVDDNVRLEIFNKKFQAQTLEIKGFRGPGKSNGLQTFALEVQKGTYTIKAFLQQIPGKSIYAGNPMGLAVNIKTAYVTVQKEVTLLRSWNQNPFGAALTIQAPPPPIPQEPIDETATADPCPPNPIWTTRHPDSSDQWHPVTHRFASGRRSWSRFMNRYAMSPVLPIGTKGSGYSGSQWSNTWTANIPYTGFYVFKGTVDNFADVTITQDPDSSEVLEITTQEVKKVNGFRTEKDNLTINKIFLEKGKAKIDITVRNGERIKYKQVTKKVFNTKDWVTKPTEKSSKVNVDFDVYGQGSKRNMGLKFIFKEKGGKDTFTIDNVATNEAVETIKKRVKRNTDYKVTAIATGTFSVKNTTNEFNIDYVELNPSNESIRVVNDGKKIELKDGKGSGANVEFEIRSTSPGVTAKFSNDGRRLKVNGKGDVTIRIKYDDNPNYAGEAVRSISIAGTTWRKESTEYGEETKTLKIGNSNFGVTSGASSTKNISFKFSHDDARDGNRIRIPELNINSVKPSGNKGPFNPEEVTTKIETGKVYEVEFVTENKAFLRLRDNGKKIECNDNTDSDHKDAIIRISDGTFFDLVNGGENGQPQNIGKAKFRVGSAFTQTTTTTTTTTSNLVPEQGTSKVFGRGKKGTESNIPGQIIFADIIGSANDNDDMQIRCSRGIFTPSNKRKNIKGTSGQGTQKRNTWDLTFRVDADEETVAEPITSIGEGFGKYTTLNKELSRSVTTGGPTPNSAPVILNPTLATYRNGSLGPFLSPFFPSGTREGGSNLQGRTWDMVWENVDFPIAGDYKMEIEADDTLEVFIGENLSDSFGGEGYKSVGKTRVTKGVEVFAFNVPNPGKRDIKLILQNINIPGTTFQQNPTVAACKITCEIPVEVADTRSWLINPVGISAVLLAPPCQRKIEGRGKVEQVTIVEPGNTYPPTGSGGPGVPSEVTITEITTDKPGIGYTPGDLVCVEKENGTKQCFSPTLGEFGKIVGVGITPIPITRYPKITTTTSTGVGFIPNIITELRVDTPEVDPDTVIQVTDLAGLKQNGYIEGRPYYGEVFFKDGIPFAGRYETAGRLIQVYATLQESIDAEVTTRPSAIQRSGTDINSNNPRLNIPGTPDNLV